jgi:tetratricopeptide (TPR) repeat protein
MADGRLQELLAGLARYEATRDPDQVLDPSLLDLAQAILTETTQDLSSGNVPQSPSNSDVLVAALGPIAKLYWERFHAQIAIAHDDKTLTEADPALADLTRAVTLFQVLIQIAPDSVPESLRELLGPVQLPADEDTLLNRGWKAWYQRAVHLLDRTLAIGDRPGLEEAISLLRRALNVSPPDCSDQAGMLSNLGMALRMRFERIGKIEDLDEAVQVGRQAVEAAPTGHPDRAHILSSLGLALQRRFERTGQHEDLAEAVQIGKQAVQNASTADAMRPAYLSNLGSAMRIWSENTGRTEDLDEAVQISRQAIQIAPLHHPDRAAMLSNLGLALQRRFERTGQHRDLSEAIAVGRRAVQAAVADDPGQAAHLSNLGSALFRRHEHMGRTDDLDEAIQVGRLAVQAIPADNPDRPAYLSNLGLALRARFERTGLTDDLDEAVQAARQAVQGTPSDHPDRSMYLSNLGSALRVRFEWTGQNEDLDEAVQVGRRALEAPAIDNPARVGRSSNLGLALLRRFERNGQIGDLNEAVRVGREAAEACPADHPLLAGYVSNLGLALELRYDRLGHTRDLDEAVHASRRAVEIIQVGHPDRAMYLSNLGSALQRRYESADQPDDLEEAITIGWQAVNATSGDDPVRGGRLTNLGSALRMRFERAGQIEDLDEAIRVGREAAQVLPADHPDRAGILSNLGLALQQRFRHTGQTSDLNETLRAWQVGAGLKVAPIDVRVQVGVTWGRLAADQERHEEAMEGFAAAVGLLSVLAGRTLDRLTQEHHLERWTGIAREAAACALGNGDTARAVVLLEEGRGVLLGHALAGRGPDWARLRVADSGLADRLEKVRDELDQLASRSMPRAATSLAATDGDDEPGGKDYGPSAWRAQAAVVDRGRELASQWEVLVAQARQLLDGFLQPPSYRQLRQAAAGGPAVLVNVSEYRSDALIVTADGEDPHQVPLPGLNPQILRDQVNAFLAGLGARDSQAADTRVHQVLEWLWEAIADPVLDALDRLDSPSWSPPPSNDSGLLPRIWWCPTGLLNFLPLHAAGHYGPGGLPVVGEDGRPQSVVDRMVSSYTPTLRALLDARSRQAAAPARPGLRVVAMPRTPGLANGAPLPATRKEVAWLGAHQFDPDPLVGEQATRAAVLDGLRRHAWVHLACHGAQNIQDPSAGRLWVHDGVVQVGDLIGLRLQHAQLAVLTACETARVGARLVDEVISLASALQLAGYQHVVATQWAIVDVFAPKFTRKLYQQLHRGLPVGQLDPHRAARATHHATLELRAVAPDPIIWAAFTHTGP